MKDKGKIVETFDIYEREKSFAVGPVMSCKNIGLDNLFVIRDIFRRKLQDKDIIIKRNLDVSCNYCGAQCGRKVIPFKESNFRDRFGNEGRFGTFTRRMPELSRAEFNCRACGHTSSLAYTDPLYSTY